MFQSAKARRAARKTFWAIISAIGSVSTVVFYIIFAYAHDAGLDQGIQVCFLGTALIGLVVAVSAIVTAAQY